MKRKPTREEVVAKWLFYASVYTVARARRSVKRWARQMLRELDAAPRRKGKS